MLTQTKKLSHGKAHFSIFVLFLLLSLSFCSTLHIYGVNTKNYRELILLVSNIFSLNIHIYFHNIVVYYVRTYFDVSAPQILYVDCKRQTYHPFFLSFCVELVRGPSPCVVCHLSFNIFPLFR